MRRFLEDFFAPERSLWRYILGTAALTVAIQWLYDEIRDAYGAQGAFGLVALLVLVVVVIVGMDVRRARRAARRMVPAEAPVTPHRGLILLISPRNLEVPLIALEAHGERLEHCWLIATPQSLETAYDVAKVIHERWPEVRVHDLQETLVADPEAVESTWKIVDRIYGQVGPQVGLDEVDIVADITGGIKPMTAGMALACRSPQRKMQYVKTPRDAHGQPIPGAPRWPVLITQTVVS